MAENENKATFTPCGEDNLDSDNKRVVINSQGISSNETSAQPDPRFPYLVDFWYDEDLDEEAIVKVFQDNPSAAKAKYKIGACDVPVYPLYTVIERRASFNIVKSIYRAFPEAARNKYFLGRTLLHEACIHKASPEVISLLMDAWPEAMDEEDSGGVPPLVYALQRSMTFETVALMLEKCPNGVKKKTSFGKTCLHGAFTRGGRSREDMKKTICLILEKWPEAVKEKETMYGMIPLHRACTNKMDLDVILLLLEKWPASVKVKDDRQNREPSFYYCGVDENVKMALTNVHNLIEGDVDQTIALRIMEDFIRIRWRGGIVLLFDLYPLIFQSLENIPIKVVPNLLLMLGSNCKLPAMYAMIRGRQDLLNTA